MSDKSQLACPRDVGRPTKKVRDSTDGLPQVNIKHVRNQECSQVILQHALSLTASVLESDIFNFNQCNIFRKDGYILICNLLYFEGRYQCDEAENKPISVQT